MDKLTIEGWSATALRMSLMVTLARSKRIAARLEINHQP
jgi:hypothetical protein